MIDRIIPPQYVRALDEGEMLIMVAIPFDDKKETIRFGFNKKALFDAKLMPNGQTWISQKAMMDLPQEFTSMQVIETLISRIIRMAPSVGGCAIDLMLADVDQTANN